MSARRHRRGFTLIEVLVSVFLLAIVSALAYQALNYVRRARESTETAFARLRSVELAVHTLVTDFEQLEPRPVRDVVGTSVLPALLADPRTTNLVTLTRGGWPNTPGLPRGTLQRVTYRLDGTTLVREHLTVLDATLANAPVRRDLLKDVVSVHLRYMDSTRTWQEQWPPIGMGGAAGAPSLGLRPLAIEVAIETRDFGRIVRIAEVPG
jgi:general secretion pathway protein J